MADNYISKYTGAEIDSQLDKVNQNEIDIANKVNKTTTVNGHPLSSNVTVTKNDVGLDNVNNTSDLDKPISTAMQNELNNKVDKEEGKGLSTNDYTNADKIKLNGLSNTIINDTLTSTSIAEALSANMGKSLNDKIGDIGTALDIINGEEI